ncbi:MAG TPA: transposase, partial [Firmicutes bacterium]|nr:transposase [Bacillota bacterium]
AKENGYSSGYDSGKSDGVSNIAKNMLKKNMSIEDISDVTGLTIDEINNLK